MNRLPGAFGFLWASELWLDEKRVNEPAYFGWFSNSIPSYPETLHLKTAVHSRNVGLRPYVELEATDHPLALEQRRGITMVRVQHIAEQMHPQNCTPTLVLLPDFARCIVCIIHA